MRPATADDMPPRRRKALGAATRLEYLYLVYMGVTIVLMYFVMGSSQAMRAAWLEDLLSLVPGIGFLLTSHSSHRSPTARYPYGLFGLVSLAFTVASCALFGMGTYLFLESLHSLVTFHHPTIGPLDFFGQTVWSGWLMLPALLWAGVPVVLFGLRKMALARLIHDKTLYTDGLMNKADWMTALAAGVGILGVSFGFWWADALAAALIALDIVHDGYRQLRSGLESLLGRQPVVVDGSQVDPAGQRLITEWEKLDWVKGVQLRMRDVGHVFFGEAYIVPVDQRNVIERACEAQRLAYDLDWRLHDIVVQVVSPDGPEEPLVETDGHPTGS